MTPEAWKRIEELFQAACTLSPAKRKRFLDKACGDDRCLREEVASLLRSHDNAGGHLEEVVFRAGFYADAITEEQRAPDHIQEGRAFGVYRLTRLIDAGGMGAVYEAVRDDEAYEKRVAVKVIKGGMVTEESLRRFVQERQTLANLDHPNIARLLDGGTSEEGQPYLVMEYIEGEPIDRWCDAKQLSVAARLKLFRAVCAAVHCAHKNLIVHRDIKPANILVMKEGIPKLLDFGIAKILDSKADITSTTHRILTPQYASPEQLQGRAITIASDVYSLGIVLYLLLTGRIPFETDNLPVHELVRRICEEEPPKPSTVVKRPVASGGDSAEGGDAEAIAQRRGSSPERLSRRLSGDLNTIILMALRKEPERRYASVEQFSADIQRYLDGLPVIARTDTLFYRGFKFIRRHWAAVGGLAMIMVILVGGIYFTLKEKDRAESQAQAARRVRSSWVELLRSFNPYGEGGRVLDMEAEELLRKLGDQPGERADLMDSLAEVWEGAHLYKNAIPWRKRALEVRRHELAEDPQKIAEAQYLLGYALHRAWNNKEAETYLRNALQIQAAMPEASLPAALTERALATTLWGLDNFEAPMPLFEKALSRLRGVQGSSRVELIRTMADFAAFLEARGNLDRSEFLLRKTIEMIEGDPVEDPLIAAMLYRRLGMLLWNTPGFSNAEKYVHCALDGLHNARVSKIDQAFIACRTDLALLIAERSKIHNLYPSIPMCIELHLQIKRIFGSQSIEYADACMAVARVRDSLIDMEIYAEKALKIYKQVFGENHLKCAEAMTLIGARLVQESNSVNKYRKALKYLQRALRIRKDRLPPGHWKTADTAGWLGSALTKLGYFPEAEPLVVRSYHVLNSTHGPRHPRTGESLKRIVDLYEAWGKDQHADSYRKLLDAKNRRWPFHPSFRDDDGSMNKSVSLNYDDDFLEKIIELPVDPHEAVYARLWVFGLVYQWGGQQYRDQMSHHVMVNGELDHEKTFDLGPTYNFMPSQYSQSSKDFYWAPIEIPVDWLGKGANTFLLYEDEDYVRSNSLPREWEYNNLRVGIDTDNDFNRSWWHENVDEKNGRAMARFLNAMLSDHLIGPIPSPIPVRERWRRSLKNNSPETIQAARQEATEQCRGELMIFLELVYDR